MKVTRSIEINATPEAVWPFLTEPEKIIKWYLPLQKFEYTNGKQGQVGATFQFEEKAAGGLMKLECTVTEWTENQAFAFKMTSGNMMKSYEERWTLAGTTSGSKFTFMENGELDMGILSKIISPIAARMSASTVEKMLLELKSLAEGS